MQRAQLDAHDQHDRVRLGETERPGGTQRGERAVAPHEAQVIALRRGPQTEAAHDRVVGAGREEPGARDGDDVGDVVGVEVRDRVEGGAGRCEEERGRPVGIDVVARPGARGQDLAARGVVEDRRLAVRARQPRRGVIELVDDGVTRLDPGHVERSAHQTTTEPVEVRLPREHVPDLVLAQHGRRDSGLDGTDGDGHTRL